MDECCSNKGSALAELRGKQASTLRTVLALNGAMFLAEFAAGLIAGSVALLADSLDMLGDALVYGFSLYVVHRSMRWKARAALAKAAIMALFGLFVLAQLVYKLAYPQPPLVETMGPVAALALAVNAVCFTLLWRHRRQDINMRSVWICSRNDIIANVGVLAAAGMVWVTSSAWPDIVVGALICALFLRSAVSVGREARQELPAEFSRRLAIP
jgi:cation diffusion facilitator family transporter